MVTDNHYRWDFIQLSTDTKPTPATSPKVADGSTLYTSDDSKLYIWYKDQWYEKTATGGGGGSASAIKELTADDYNYPDNNPTSVALWKMPEGLYSRGDGVNVNITFLYTLAKDAIALVGKPMSVGTPIYIIKPSYNNGSYEVVDWYMVSSNGGYSHNGALSEPVDALNVTSTRQPLSANQGKVLNDNIGDLTSLSTTAKTSLVAAINEIAQAGGGAKTLTTADFDYPEGDSPFAVNLENLDGGLYTIGESGVTVYLGGSTFNTATGDDIFLIKFSGYTMWISFFGFEVYVRTAYDGSGSLALNTQFMTQYNMSLYIQKNYGEPTATTFGQTGGLRTGVDSTTHEPALYICGGSDPNNPGQYIWRKANLTSI